MINSPHIKLFWKTIAANLSVAAAVYLTAWASSQAFRGEAHSFSPIWPASGISLAAILLLGPRILTGVFLPLCASSLVAGSPWLFSFLAPAGVTLSIWGASTLLRRQRFDIGLSSTRDILLLAGLGAIVPMGVSAISSASCLVLSGMMPASGLWAVASIYWATSTAGTVVVTPVILLIAKGRFLPKGICLREFLLAVFQLAIVFSSAWFAFHSESSQGLIMDSLAYLPFPFLIWVALARGLPAAALSVLIVVMTAAIFTSAGRGPFVTESTLFTIWQIEIFIAIVTTTGLLIGAGSEAQRREKILLAEAATRKAELERLKAQIHPHLLFNCLTTIHSLIRTDTTAAQAGLFSLSALLRKSLDVAKELTFSGRIMSGSEAKELGLVTRVEADPLAAAMALAREIAGKSPDAIRAGKALLEASWRADARTGLELESKLQVALIGSPNQAESVKAFFEKRDPVFADPQQ